MAGQMNRCFLFVAEIS